MRRWLLLLIVLLLPLRGWMGEAMAAEMRAQHHAQPPAAVSQSAAGDCAGHHDQAADPQAADTHDAACAACQACSTLALAFGQPAVPAAPYGAAPLVPMAVAFASAEPGSTDKPPIS